MPSKTASPRTIQVNPASVQGYLVGKFGDALEAVYDAMTALAKSRKPADLATEAYALYEQFRPVVPGGVKGWGAAGTLSLDTIRRLAR